MMSNNAAESNNVRLTQPAVTIRTAARDDDRELRRLAQLDSARPLAAGGVLVAEVEGELRAAYSVREKRAIANPFRRTTELVTMLALRTGQLQGNGRSA